jgi:hypothetical protein
MMKAPQSTTRPVSVFKPESGPDLVQLDPDVLLPSQARPRTNTLHRSEWLLLWALLTDALQVLATFHPNRPGRSYKEKKQWEADLAWVREEKEGPFSFVYVCDHLGLDRDAVRSRAERLIARSALRDGLPQDNSDRAA